MIAQRLKSVVRRLASRWSLPAPPSATPPPFAFAYRGHNVRETCVCGAPRVGIPERIFQVTDKESDPILPKYYFRCAGCGSFSAPNLYFPVDKYEQVPLEYLHIPELKWTLNRKRVETLQAVAPLPPDAVVFDLGSGEGCFTQCLHQALPASTVYAVEGDARLETKFYPREPGVIFVGSYLEPFLQEVLAKEAGPRADLVVLTDVLEHVTHPEDVLASLAQALKPGGIAYLVVPNSHTFDRVVPCPEREVDWGLANRSCQHLWMYTPDTFQALVSRQLDIVWSDDRLETDLRRDSAYSALIARRR